MLDAIRELQDSPLPELDDRGGGILGGHIHGIIGLLEFHTVFCIPLMAAASPGEVSGEAAEEVEEGPGQDNDVVDIEEADDHL